MDIGLMQRWEAGRMVSWLHAAVLLRCTQLHSGIRRPAKFGPQSKPNTCTAQHGAARTAQHSRAHPHGRSRVRASGAPQQVAAAAAAAAPGPAVGRE